MTIEDDDINIHFGVEFDSGGLWAEGMAVYLGVAVGTLVKLVSAVWGKYGTGANQNQHDLHCKQ